MNVLAESYQPPDPVDFFLPDFTGTHWDQHGYLAVYTKPAALLLLGAILAFAFLYLTSRRGEVVPGKRQYLGESAYNLIRDGMGRDVIGADFMRWVPLLVSLFFFIIINNLFGIVPFLQFPTFSRVNYAYGLAALVWIIFNAVGIIDKGPLGYLKHVTIPSGVPWYLIWLVAPLEFLSNVIVRPITLSLRLFANMFAGHLLIILFSTGGAFLLLHASNGVINKPAGVLAFALGVAIGFLELIVATLQAYVFTLLTASYIAGAQAKDH
ncbi:F0F1 ATP synthase subunit A [uncultured Jatrophihabitans sp.]|uniref:F0F1 ATP synthase subunit A n=1 Tax=uncultured Jatrophihabitans sp. TaxID=1610747 RepID=UPI0035CB02C2